MHLSELKKILLKLCKPQARIAIMGIGSYLRADDFLGVAIIQKLKRKIENESILLIEVETEPNDYFHTLEDWNPTDLIILDAANFKAQPGTFNIIKREEMADHALTSHKRSLILFLDFLSVYLPDIEVIIVGVQPANIDFEIGLSQPIKVSIQKLTNLLVSVLSTL